MHRSARSGGHEPGGDARDVRAAVCKTGRGRHGRSLSISAMDLKRVLDQTVRELRREVSKKVLKVPEIEIKVSEATSNEPWGPHGSIMGDIAQATRNFQEYHVIMGVLWKRLHDCGKNWRHVYKSLAVMEYLIANGAERVIEELREQAYQIQALLDFQYIEPNGKDQGINVQKKAQSLLALLNDRGKIRELRQTAAANRGKYRGLSSTGVSFKPSSYVSASGSYSEKDDERHGGGSSVNAQKDDDGKEFESRRSRRESNRDDCSCGELEHKEAYAASKGGGDERNSDNNFSSTDGDRNRDIDEYRQYSSGRNASRGVVAAVTRAQTTLSQSSSSGHSSSQVAPRKSVKEIFFSIKSAADDLDDLDDFDPRGTSKRSVPTAAKDESSTQSQNALEDLFADVEFQASFPPISATTSNNVLERDHLQTPYAFNPVPKPNSMKNTAKDEMFQPFSQAFPQANEETVFSDGALFDSFNPPFTSFNESPKSTPQDVLTNRVFHPMGDSMNFISNEQFQVGPSALGSPSKTSADNLDLFGPFNPFSTKDHVMAGNQAAQQQQEQQPNPPPHTNALLPATSSAFWDDPLITSLVDLAIGGGQRQDQNAPLSLNEVGINRAASGSTVSKTNRLPLGAKTFAFGRQINSTTGPGRSASDPPKST